MNEARQKYIRQDRRRIYLLAGLMVVGGGVLGLTLLRMQPVFKNDKVITAETGQGKMPSLNREAAEFVDEMRQRDAELLDKWRSLKEAKRTTQRPGHARQRYEQRLADLESDLEKFKESAHRKNSIGWGIQQQIQKMKSDPPPPFN